MPAGASRLALVGPTATGKSSLAVDVALALGDVEIISADSMQVYRGMDIGTAKLTESERKGVPHHLIDCAALEDSYSLVQYQRAVRDAVADIETRGRRPLLVGGTGLYVQAVVDELRIPSRYPAIAEELDSEPDTASLHARLAQLDPLGASRMEVGNRRRVLRALEVTLGSGKPFSSFGPGIDAFEESPWDQVGLRVARPVLRARIAQRYHQQMKAGFLDEVKRLAARQPPIGRTAAQALGYRELLAHVAGDSTVDEALDLAITRTRRFARRQESWFGRDPRITWVDAEPTDAAARFLVRRWGL